MSWSFAETQARVSCNNVLLAGDILSASVAFADVSIVRFASAIRVVQPHGSGTMPLHGRFTSAAAFCTPGYAAYLRTSRLGEDI